MAKRPLPTARRAQSGDLPGIPSFVPTGASFLWRVLAERPARHLPVAEIEGVEHERDLEGVASDEAPVEDR